jgi:hypothetical protein
MASLWEAVESGTLEDLPESLKKYAAQLNNGDPTEGYTPLQIAVKNRNLKMAKMLVDGGANPNIPCCGQGIHKGYTAVHIAAKNGDAEFITMLAKAGANLDFEGSDSWLPIHSAAFAGKRNSILALLDNGAQIDGRNRHGLTALMYCANHGKSTELRDLLQRGADITAKDQNGDTVLHHALQYQMFKLFEGEYEMPECQYDAVVILAMNGADPDIKNNEGALCTAYSVEGLRDVLRIIFHHKAEFATSLTEWNYMTLLSARIEHFVGMGLNLRHATDLYESIRKTDSNRLADKKRRAEEYKGGCPVIKSKKGKMPEVPKDGSDPSNGQCPFFVDKKKEGATAAIESTSQAAAPTAEDPSGGMCPHFQKKPASPVAPTAHASNVTAAPAKTAPHQYPAQGSQQQLQLTPGSFLFALYENRTAVLMCVICFLLGALLERKLKFTS